MSRILTFSLLILLMTAGIGLPFFANAAPPANAVVQDSSMVQYCSTDGPRSIVGLVDSTINVPDNAIITDLNVKLDIDHNNVGDLRVELLNGGTTTTILRRPRGGTGNCDGNNIRNNIADDEASASFSAACVDNGSAYTEDAAYQAGEPAANNILAVYDGRTTEGTWTLNISDERWNGVVGTFQSWCVQFEVQQTPPTPTATPTLVPTLTATVTQTPLPTNIPTATNTPPPNSTPTATVPPSVTPTNTPLPSTSTPMPSEKRAVFAPLSLSDTLRTCQTTEDENSNPNNSSAEALLSAPICIGQDFTGFHNLSTDREDIYLLVISEKLGSQVPVTLNLDVVDINLNLLLYNQNAVLMGASNNPGNQDEQITETIMPGVYYVRVYRTDVNVSSQPYVLQTTTED